MNAQNPMASPPTQDFPGQPAGASMASTTGLGAAFFRPCDAARIGVDARRLQRLVEDGSVERVSRGLYRLARAAPTEHYTIAAVCARVPDAIVCLLTALEVYGIGTQLPPEVWMAIAHKSRQPRLGELPVKVIRFSAASLHYGVVEREFEGVPARITTPARTVVDCFRFRRLVGTDVALEAMREALRERRATADEIWRAAEVCRAKSLVEPVLEAMFA